MPESPFVLEGRQTLREGEIRTFSVTWPQFTTVSSGATEAYVNGSSDTSLTGSEATSGNVQTLRTLTVPVGYGGLTIVLEARVDVSGERFKTAIICPIIRPGQEQ